MLALAGDSLSHNCLLLAVTYGGVRVNSFCRVTKSLVLGWTPGQSTACGFLARCVESYTACFVKWEWRLRHSTGMESTGAGADTLADSASYTQPEWHGQEHIVGWAKSLSRRIGDLRNCDKFRGSLLNQKLHQITV
jgi:hypothetical protein